MIPIMVAALGTITTKFEKYNESLGIEIRIEHVQKSALLGTARIIREYWRGYCFETFDIWLMSAVTEKTRDTNISAL